MCNLHHLSTIANAHQLSNYYQLTSDGSELSSQVFPVGFSKGSLLSVKHTTNGNRCCKAVFIYMFACLLFPNRE
jgi:hypothetical protein